MNQVELQVDMWSREDTGQGCAEAACITQIIYSIALTIQSFRRMEDTILAWPHYQIELKSGTGIKYMEQMDGVCAQLSSTKWLRQSNDWATHRINLDGVAFGGQGPNFLLITRKNMQIDIVVVGYQLPVAVVER